MPMWSRFDLRQDVRTNQSVEHPETVGRRTSSMSSTQRTVASGHANNPSTPATPWLRVDSITRAPQISRR